MQNWVDAFYVMTYDYHGSWETRTHHQAALFYQQQDLFEDPDFNIEATIHYLLNQNLLASKLILGIPLYGRAWNQTTGLFQPAGAIAMGTWEPGGVLDYKDLYQRIQTQPDLYQVFWDSVAKVPYVYASNLKDGWFSTYENARSVEEKTRYVQQKGLGGVFFWELSADRPLGEGSLVEKAAHMLLFP